MTNKILTSAKKTMAAKWLLLFICVFSFGNTKLNAQSSAHASFTFSVSGNAVTLINTSTVTSGTYDYSNSYFVMDNGYWSPYLNQITNPYTYTYQTAGVYNVCLTVADSATHDIDSICHAINVSSAAADTISGYVYYDANSNGVKDAGEQGAANQIVYMCKNSCPYTYTNTNGYFQFITSAGNNNYIKLANGILTTQPGAASSNAYYFNVSGTGQHIGGKNFGINSNPCAGQAQFTAYTGNCGNKFSYSLTNNGYSNMYIWNYGDGFLDTLNYYSSQNSQHTYAISGNYNVTLISLDSNLNCSDTSSQLLNVNISLQTIIASFSYYVHNDSITFTSTTTGPVGLHQWNFDNKYSNSASPTFTFATSGLYYVYYTAYSNSQQCSDSILQTIFLNIPNADTLSGALFNDTNNNGIKDIGEAGRSNEYVSIYSNGNYNYTYTDANGNYQFIVASGTDSIFAYTPSGYVQTLPLLPTNYYSFTTTGNQHISNLDFGFYMTPCVAITTATTTLQSGSTYTFNCNTINGTSTKYYTWYFGDGNQIANGQNTSTTHQYTTNGTFTPYVIVYSNNCRDSFLLSPITISGLSACAGQAQFNASRYYCGGIYYFGAANYVQGNSYNWNFGDGTFGSVFSMNHTYASSSTYTVTLISYNPSNNCYDTSTQNIAVSVFAKPTASFTYSTTGTMVNFTSTSTGAITTYYWSYDDGGSDNIANPSHTFVTGGMHWVNLSVYNAQQCSDSITQQILIPIPNADTLTGNVFNDVNNNGIKDAGELGIANQYIYLYAQGTSTYAYTDVVGNYSFILPSGTDSIYAPNIWMYSRTLPLNTDHYVVTTTGNQHLSGFDFGYVDTVSTIAGHVFFDTNGNGTQDAGELNASAIRVDVYGNTMSTHVYTDYFGNYTALLYYGNGTYNITCNPVLSGYTGYNISTSPTQYNITTSNATTYNGNDFGLNPISSTTGDNLMVNITPANTAVPGYGAWYYVTVKNIGSTTVGGNVVFNYDPSLIFANAINGTNNSTTHQVSWVVSSLSPGAYSQNTIMLNVASITSLGSVLNHNTSVVLSSGTDVDLANNTTNYQQVVVGSYDPNEKTVSPVGEGANGAINPNNNGELTYTIRFQNTGTAPAVNVVVKDVIDADLDLSTLQMLESSNNNTLSVDDITRLATWKFQNIMLPDSTHDEPHSHGYLQFKIKLKSGLTQGATLNNTANIYFDFNSPVVTNTTKNTVDFSLSVANKKDELPTISVAPNPMNEFTTIRIDGLKGTADINVTITNVLGEKVKTLTHQTNIITLNRNELSSGIYFYELKNNGNKIGNGKIVME